MNKDEFLQEMINNKIIMGEEDYVCLEYGGSIKFRVRMRNENNFFYLRCKDCRNEQSLFKNTF